MMKSPCEFPIGPEPCLCPHRLRRRKPCIHPLPHDRHRHEEGYCEDFGREWKVVLLERDIGVHETSIYEIGVNVGYKLIICRYLPFLT